MRPRAERDLDILSAIGEGTPLTQRALAERLGVALGLANLYVKRLIVKGHVKVTEFPRKPRLRGRLRYLLTPRGIAEKARLTREFLNQSLALYRQTRQALHASLRPLADAGHRRVALYGTGEAAELAYLSLRELGLEPRVVVDAAPCADAFLGMPVRKPADVPWDDIDVVVVAAPGPAAAMLRTLAGHGVAPAKILVVGAAPGRRVGQRFSS